MNEAEIFRELCRCNAAHHDALVVLLGLREAFLPDKSVGIATRAKAVLELCKLPGGPGIAKLSAALIEIGILPEKRSVASSPSLVILAANPIDTDRLLLEEEARLITNRLREGEQGRAFRVEIAWAVRVSDVSRLLLEYRPTIVHFTGHGSPTGQIVLQDENEHAQPAPARAFAELFAILSIKPECVVLNACYSDDQATLFSRSIRYVVGMTREIGDESAIQFSGGFYRGIAFGEDYQQCFRLGCNAIDLASLPDAAVPHYISGGEQFVGESVPPARDWQRSISPDARLRNHETQAVQIVRPKRTWKPLASGTSRQEDVDAPRLYTVWFGTNRAPIDSTDPTKGYSPRRDDFNLVRYGSCKVAVPKSHRIGSVGSPWWKRILTCNDDRLKVIETFPLEESEFWSSVREYLGEWALAERIALVFLHGFNTTFEGAALRAAQLGVDLQLPLTAFFSWASKGVCTLRGYSADEATIEASEPQITEFLTRFAVDSGAESVHLMAHSMGNRGLLRSLENMARRAEETSNVPFGQIFFAAPDIDVGTFRNLAKGHSRLARRTTLYVSSKDKALASSGLLHDYPRAGYSPPLTVVPGIDTIEVSNIDISFLGHGYYAAARDLLQDVHKLILSDSDPTSRFALKPFRTGDGQNYWQIMA